MSPNLRFTGTSNCLRHLVSECLIATEGSPSIVFHGCIVPGENRVQNGFAAIFLRLPETRTFVRRRIRFVGGSALKAVSLQPDLLFLPMADGTVPRRFSLLETTILDAMSLRLHPEVRISC